MHRLVNAHAPLVLIAIALTAPSTHAAAATPAFEIALEGLDVNNKTLSLTFSKPGLWGHGSLSEITSVSFNFEHGTTELQVIAVCNEYLSGTYPAATVILPRRNLTDLAIKTFNFSYLEILPEGNYTRICTSYDRSDLKFSVGVEAKVDQVAFGESILPSIEMMFRRTGFYSLPFEDVSGLSFDTIPDFNGVRYGVYFCEGERATSLFMVFGSMLAKFKFDGITAVDIREMQVGKLKERGACQKSVAVLPSVGSRSGQNIV